MTCAENGDAPYAFEAKDGGQGPGTDADAAEPDTADVGAAETDGAEPAEPDDLDEDNPLHGLAERTKADPGAPFEMEVLVALSMLRRDAPDKFVRMLKRLKGAGCGITDLRRALTDVEGGGGKGDETQADILIGIANAADLFHTADLVAYVDLRIDGHRETWPVRSKGFKHWLVRQYYEKTKGAPNSEATHAALGVIEAKAHFDGPEQRVHIRIGGLENGTIYVDLCDDAWRAVEIDADGWRIVDEPPLRFRRTPGMLPLPVPVRGGSIENLRPFLNVGLSSAQRAKLGTGSDPDTGFVLAVAWALAALNPNGPYPVLSFAGEQGTAKSTAARVLRSLVDPNVVPLRTPPRDDRDMFISANNAWTMVYDNLSSLSEELADAMCRLATGGGFAPRALYTDADEVLFNATRPQILNGIEDIVTRPDLADRCIFLTLEPISDEDRLAEKKFWAEFAEVQPGILGALLDGVSERLRRLPEIELPVLPRMADFSLWVTACETVFWPAGTFMAAYVGNLDDANALLVEASTIAAVLKTMVEKKEIGDATRWFWDADRNVQQWSGTATQLARKRAGITGPRSRFLGLVVSDDLQRGEQLGRCGRRFAFFFCRVKEQKQRTRAFSVLALAVELDVDARLGFSQCGRDVMSGALQLQDAVVQDLENASATSAINENNELQRTESENAAVCNVQRSVRFADGDGVADGGASDADGQVFSGEVPQSLENASFSNFPDAADGADAVSPSSSVGAKEKKTGCWGRRHWQRVASLHGDPGEPPRLPNPDGGGRWYPGVITLANGDVLAVSGHPDDRDLRGHNNDQPERYSPSTNTWMLQPGERLDRNAKDRFYPRMHLLPDGNVFIVSPVTATIPGVPPSVPACRIYDPLSGTTVGQPCPAPESGHNLYSNTYSYASVLLPLLPGDGYRPRILLCGRRKPRRIDFPSGPPWTPVPSWKDTAQRGGAAAGKMRLFCTAVILPTGEIFVSGGLDGSVLRADGSITERVDAEVDYPDARAVKHAEIYSPGIDWHVGGRYEAPDSWRTVDEATVSRNYHSTALLMPDGRVWTAGSSKNHALGDPHQVGELRIEVWKPPYDRDSNRPDVTAAPASISYRHAFEVSCTQAARIGAAALIRCGSTTHGFDFDQRYVGLEFRHVGGDRLEVESPPDNKIAPPGYYSLWVLNEARLPCKFARFVCVGLP